MKLKIIRIENRIVTCKIKETDSLVDIARRWLAEDIQIDDVIDIDVTKKNDI